MIVSIIIDDGSKESREAMALVVVSEAKQKYGNSVDTILNWLIGQPCTSDKSEMPDFILRGSSGVIGVEHFEVSANSVVEFGKWQSPLARASNVLHSFKNGKADLNDVEKEIDRLIKTDEKISYASSVRAFESIFNKHLSKVKTYRKRLSDFGGERLVFLIEMLAWNFVGLTALGNTSFDCNMTEVPLTKEIVDIVSSTDDLDAVVLLYNFYPFHESTVFAFTPQQARGNAVGIEIYEFVGNSELVENNLAKIMNTQANQNENILSDVNRQTIMADCTNAFELISAGKSCIVQTNFYDFLVGNGIVNDKRR